MDHLGEVKSSSRAHPSHVRSLSIIQENLRTLRNSCKSPDYILDNYSETIFNSVRMSQNLSIQVRFFLKFGPGTVQNLLEHVSNYRLVHHVRFFATTVVEDSRGVQFSKNLIISTSVDKAA